MITAELFAYPENDVDYAHGYHKEMGVVTYNDIPLEQVADDLHNTVKGWDYATLMVNDEPIETVIENYELQAVVVCE